MTFITLMQLSQIIPVYACMIFSTLTALTIGEGSQSSMIDVWLNMFEVMMQTMIMVMIITAVLMNKLLI